jgi:hypothetical protein
MAAAFVRDGLVSQPIGRLTRQPTDYDLALAANLASHRLITAAREIGSGCCARAGMVSALPQSWHLPLLPAAASFVRIGLPHSGQSKVIVIVGGPRRRRDRTPEHAAGRSGNQAQLEGAEGLRVTRRRRTQRRETPERRGPQSLLASRDRPGIQRASMSQVMLAGEFRWSWFMWRANW